MEENGGGKLTTHKGRRGRNKAFAFSGQVGVLLMIAGCPGAPAIQSVIQS
jgi:hypothetical protein